MEHNFRIQHVSREKHGKGCGHDRHADLGGHFAGFLGEKIRSKTVAQEVPSNMGHLFVLTAHPALSTPQHGLYDSPPLYFCAKTSMVFLKQPINRSYSFVAIFRITFSGSSGCARRHSLSQCCASCLAAVKGQLGCNFLLKMAQLIEMDFQNLRGLLRLVDNF